MVHNGIEYGDMQMICEAYDLMNTILNIPATEMGAIFEEWNQGELDSFLIEITADILKQTDPKTKQPFVDIVLDAAGQKGTGKWTSINALEMGVPAFPLLLKQCLLDALVQSKKNDNPRHLLSGPKNDSNKTDYNKEELISSIRDALYCSKICSYAQDFN